MSFFIVEEGRFLLYSILLGIGITFVYDCFRIARRVIAHGIVWISLEDFLYWIFVSVSIFYLLYYENNGAFRWFAILGALLGMLLFRITLSGIFVKYCSLFFLWLKGLLSGLLAFLFRPLRAAGRAAGKMAAGGRRKTQRMARIMKKRLTVWLRMAKMILCKRCGKTRRGRKNGKEKNRIPSEEKRKQARYADGHNYRIDAAGSRFRKGG